MACRLSLPIWPDSLDCISWSEDNLIAIAGGSQIAILSPCFRDPDPNGSYWSSTVFRANAFTADEVPLRDPLSFKNFSPGEELSLRSVQALAWSSPGLSRFKGSALAVLSSNHVLSIWDCGGKPDSPSSWHRKVIINHAIQNYYSNYATSSAGTQNEHELRQVRQRVRAFAWIPKSSNDSIVDTSLETLASDEGCQFLAVSTEAGDILLLLVRSPYNILSATNQDWRVDFVHAVSVLPMTTQALGHRVATNNGISPPHDRRSCIVDHLTCGPWRREGGDTCHISKLALVTNGQLFSVKIVGQFERHPLHVKTIAPSCERLIISRSDIVGPMRFVPKTDLLIAFAADAVFCVDTAADAVGDKRFSQHHLDGRWEEISGIAFSNSDRSLPHLHITSHLYSGNAITTTLPLPLNDETVITPPNWQTAVNETKASFSNQYNLNSCVLERVWGMASSPLGEYVMTATTTLPSDALHYIIPSDQSTTINITREVSAQENRALLVQRTTSLLLDTTAEAFLFSLQRYSQDNPTDSAAVVQAMLNAVNGPNAPAELDESDGILYGEKDASESVRHLRSRIFMHDGSFKARLVFLTALATQKQPDPSQTFKPIISRLVSEVCKLPAGTDKQSSLSQQIRNLYHVVGSRLRPDVPAALSDGNAETQNEECRICQKKIPFESIKWARCIAGHQYTRCALTFLAIQEPRITKQCKICGTQYLNEWLLPEFFASKQDDDITMVDLDSEHATLQSPNPQADGWTVVSKDSARREPEQSLARFLFAAVDKCIYCGGIFVA